MKDQVKGLLLADLYDLAYRAQTGTSFSPEKRAYSIIVEYSNLLQKDLDLLGEHTGNYKEKFIKHLSDWLVAKSNCISTMITGAANFPVSRAQKANNREHAKYEEFSKWRDKYFVAVNRQPTLPPEDELKIAEIKLMELQIAQESWKAINKMIKKFKLKTLPEIIEKAEELEIEQKYLEALTENQSYDGEKFVINGYYIPAYRLTNNNNTIKRTAEKVKTMLNRIQVKESFEDLTFEGGYITIEDDRVKIYHDEKPSDEVRALIKSKGFRWSPFWKCWCRKHTENALAVVKFELLPEFNK